MLPILAVHLTLFACSDVCKVSEILRGCKGTPIKPKLFLFLLL